MSIINNILESDFVQTGLCTIVEGSEILAPATLSGNILELATENEMLQTVAKVLQSISTAFLAVWSTWNVMGLFGDEFIWNYMEVVNYTAMGAAALVMSVPVLLSLAKYLSPENKEQIENFQKTYATALKVVNIITAGIALGWFVTSACMFWELALVTPIVLSAGSLISSAYTLHKNLQLPA